MDAVKADKPEEGAQEPADLRGDAAVRQLDEFLKLQPHEDEAEQAGDQQEDLGPQLVARIGRGEGQAARIARKQQSGRLPGDARYLDEPAYGGSPGRRAPLHGEGREEAGEHHDVGEEEDPEAVADDDPLVRRARHPVAGAFDGLGGAMAAVAEPVRVLADPPDGLGGGGKRRRIGHADASCWRIRSSSAWRAARRARSTLATSSAGTWNSWTSRHAKMTKPT